MQFKVFIKSGISLAILMFLVWGCKNVPTPKPRAYFRISFPEHKYDSLENKYPYFFEYPEYTRIIQDKAANAEPYWINIDYPAYNGKIHISYKVVKDNLAEMLEDNRKLAYKHSIKADAIGERLYMAPEKKVYGILYDIKGDAASSVQFFLTDSVRNFLRGSLYFNTIPNKDSLAPVVDFVKEDIMHMMETFEWKSLPITK